MIRTETNRIIFEGDLGSEIRSAIACIYQLSQKLGYQDLGEKLIFEVAKEVEGFGSREFGRRARAKIDNILVDKGAVIEFDFSDVPLVSSSFADEVFGKLFVDLGAMDFMRRCTFKAVDPTVRRLIDRAISQRMKAG
jgi:hypothetical protein